MKQLVYTDIFINFQHLYGILLQDSPQLLDDYIYIEFEDANGNDLKFRIPYPHDKYDFIMNTTATNQILHILSNIVKQHFRPAF